MKMNEFMTALQTHLATQQPNYPDNAESILEVLFDAYNESSGFDNAAIKADFEELYRLMNGKPLKEIDEIIYAVCTLCRDHEKAGFIEGVKVGMSLAKELDIPKNKATGQPKGCPVILDYYRCTFWKYSVSKSLCLK